MTTRFTRFARTAFSAVAALALVAGLTAATVDEAEAGKRNRALAAGAVGLAAGAIIGSALAAQPRRVIIYDQAPVYRGLQPWTPAWYSYCSAKYRSFNPQTGHFLGYDGRYHFCR